MGHLPSQLIAALADTGQFVGNRVVIRGYLRADLIFLKARLRMPLDDLSAREAQIAQQLAQGHNHQEIAQVLHLAPSTVRSHMKHIYEKLGVHNKAQLIATIHAG